MMVPPSPVWNGLIPRDRMAATAAPIIPNTAPEAPTVTALGSRIITPSAPDSMANT